MYQVAVRSAPAHELIGSLGLYLDRKSHKLTDLGTAWATKVKRQLDPAFAAQLEADVPIDGVMLHYLIEQHTGDPDPSAFLSWLAAMDPAEFYECASPCRSDQAGPLPADLRAHRDLIVEIHTRWNEQYFAKLDPAITSNLATEATRRRALIQGQSPVEAVEAATNGIVVGPGSRIAQILLIPGYHHRPLNRFWLVNDIGIFHYGYDDPGSDLALARALRALPDESRIRILRFISTEEHSFMEIVRHTGLALSTVHHHLVTLRAAGLVRVFESTPHPGATAQNTARYRFRPAVLQGLGARLTAMILGGDAQ